MGVDLLIQKVLFKMNRTGKQYVVFDAGMRA
jgi:hypothetical protein